MNYQNRIISRTRWHYFLGWLIRFRTNCKYALIRRIARSHGATIGEGSIIPWKLARNANANLIIGSHCCISTSDIDLRAKTVIGNYVMISSAVRILNMSHDIHSPGFEQVGNDLHIEDYCWLVGCLVIPRVSRIGYGAVCGAGSVITKDVSPMSVIGGNPGVVICQRKCVHSEFFPEALNGGDFGVYRTVWKHAKERRKLDL